MLQDWLTSIEIKYYESKVNLNWKNILKSIKEVRLRVCSVLLAHWHRAIGRAANSLTRQPARSPVFVQDPEGFIEDGGWSFLDAEQSDSEDEDGEEESDFAPRSVCMMVATAPARLACHNVNSRLHI